MSIAQIVKVNIATQSLNMAQKGFGVPLILGVFDHPDTWRVRTFSNLDELLKWQTLLIDEAEAEEKAKELIEKKQDELRNSEVYKAAQKLLAQSPRVSEFKVGRIYDEDTDIVASFDKILDSDSDFYGVFLAKSMADENYPTEAQKLAGRIALERMILGLSVNDQSKVISEKLKEKKADRVFCIHDPKAEQLACAWMGKMLPQAPGSSSWAYQELKEVSPSRLNTTKLGELKKLNINRYMDISGVGVTLEGQMSSGKYIDIVRGIDWLNVRLQERLFRLLMINKKISYTLKNMDLVRAEILGQLKEAIYQGVLAQNPEPEVSLPTPNEVDQVDRDNRLLRKVHFKARLAGAIHTIEIHGTVSA